LVWFWLVLAYTIAIITLYFVFTLIRVVFPDSCLGKMYFTTKTTVQSKTSRSKSATSRSGNTGTVSD
jgi:hypothetical protein